MEFQKIMNLLDVTSDNKDLSRFVTKKWMEVYDHSEKNYNANKEIRIKTSMLRSDLCDYSSAYIIVKGYIIVINPDNAKRNKAVAFKNTAPFIKCISKINGIKIDNAEDLDVVIPMYNLLEYSKNYWKTTESQWNYYRDQPSNPLSTNSESFKYKTSITGNTYNVDDDDDNYDENKIGKKEAEIVIPLKYLSNFWRSLNIPLINCEVELILTWFKNCVLIDKLTRDANYGADPIVHKIDNPENATFKITDTKLHVPVVTLSKENDTKLLEKLKSGFKRIIKWNKYRSQMIIQNNNNNPNYLIDPKFTNANTLFVS